MCGKNADHKNHRNRTKKYPREDWEYLRFGNLVCWQNWQLTNLILHTMLCMDRIGHLRGWHFRSNAAHKSNKKHNNTHFAHYSKAQHSIAQYSSYTNFRSIFNAFQECTCFGIYTVVVSDGWTKWFQNEPKYVVMKSKWINAKPNDRRLNNKNHQRTLLVYWPHRTSSFRWMFFSFSYFFLLFKIQFVTQMNLANWSNRVLVDSIHSMHNCLLFYWQFARDVYSSHFLAATFQLSRR